MALAQLHEALDGKGTLFKAICGACWRAATDIENEDAGTANHANRLIWAAEVRVNRKAVARAMLEAILTNATLAADPYGENMTVTDYDNAVSFVVAEKIDIFATGG